MGAINLNDIHKFFGEVHVIKGVDLEISRSIVDFPQPEGPTKTTNSPSSATRETSKTTWSSP